MTDKKIDSEYTPVIVALPDADDPYKSKLDPQFSSIIEYPRFSLGFHHYIHQSRGKTAQAFEQFEGKKRVYLVMNKFERYIDDYKQDINGVSQEYFNIGKEPKILSRALFKLWEILMYFDILPNTKSGLTTAHIAEGPGSFIQATMFFRDMFAKKGASKTDKYHAITLHPGDGKYIPAISEEFVKHYSKEKPQRLHVTKTHSRKEAQQSPSKTDGDLTNPDTIRHFSGQFSKDKAHLVTADGGFEWKNENLQEQEAHRLILAEIITALKIQAKDGHFVCKFFESFTETTAQMIAILSSFYHNVYICKPLMSRMSNSEKYLVCMQFKDPKDGPKKIAELEKVLDKAFKNQDMYLNQIFSGYKLNQQFRGALVHANTEVSNHQFMRINEIVGFINKQNYRGDMYQTRRQQQIEAAKYWTDMMYPPSKEFDKHKKELTNQTLSITEENQVKAEKLATRLK